MLEVQNEFVVTSIFTPTGIGLGLPEAFYVYCLTDSNNHTEIWKTVVHEIDTNSCKHSFLENAEQPE